MTFRTLKITIIYLLFLPFSLIAQVAEIPFKLRDGRIHISFLLNGQQVDDVIFDTGAESSVLHQRVADRLGIEAHRKIKVSEAHGTSKMGISGKARIVVGDTLKVRLPGFILTDLSALEERVGREVNGIIGFDILKRYVTRIDYDRQVISLYRNRNKVSYADYNLVGINFNNRIYIPQLEVAISLPGGQTYSGQVFLDTGAGLSLSMNRPYRLENNLDEQFTRAITTGGGGLTAHEANRIVLISSLEIGGYTLPRMTISLSDSRQGVTARDGYMGLLGNEVIRRFNIILDYGKRALYMQPNRSFRESFNLPVTGLALKKKNGTVFIEEVQADSPAQSAGLQVGEEVLSVAGNRSADLDIYRGLLEAEEGNITITIRDKTGAEKEVTINRKRLL